MDAPYRLETLPLDTADDDPRWAEYLENFSAGFLGGRATDEAVAVFREGRRADGARLDMVTAEGPGLDHRKPIAAFSEAPFTLNAGAGIVDAMVVNSVAVRPSHRRRGLLNALMTQSLQRARDAGLGCAVLTASEATIYGRFGFGLAHRKQDIEIDTRRFALRPDARVADGVVEFVDPSDLRGHLDRINLAHQERYRGAHGRLWIHRERATGAWDPEENGPARKLRAVAHFSPAGEMDGYALYGFTESKDFGEARVGEVCSADPGIDLALWRALAGVDLVDRLTYDLSHPSDPLPLALVDPRAVKSSGITDGVWLRILDPGVALAQRGFESDGSVVLGLNDPLGWASGAWRVEVSQGRAMAEPTDSDPDVTMQLATLARLHFGDRTVENLAQAGLVTGAPEALRRAGRLFAVGEPPVNLTRF